MSIPKGWLSFLRAAVGVLLILGVATALIDSLHVVAPVARVKPWPAQPDKHFPEMTFFLKTKWTDDQLSYVITACGDKDEITPFLIDQPLALALVTFDDKDGFELSRQLVPFKEFVMVGRKDYVETAGGMPIRVLAATGGAQMQSKIYARLASWHFVVIR